MGLVLRSDANASAELLGGKATALARLARAGMPIPPWFVVPPPLDSRAPSEELRQELEAACRELCPDGELLAVRSSALDEDGASHSFAGQLDSFLFVHARDVADRVCGVWRSGSSERVLAYRREHGLPDRPRPPSVLVQRMVRADVAGVAFGAVHFAGLSFLLLIPPLIVVGMGLAWIYERRQSLLASMAAHATFNLVGILFIAAIASSECFSPVRFGIVLVRLGRRSPRRHLNHMRAV